MRAITSHFHIKHQKPAVLLLQILIQAVLVLVLVIAPPAAASSSPPTPPLLPRPYHDRSGCAKRCGNLTIPYPFGTRAGCYLNKNFLITCNDSTPYLLKGNIQVLGIFLDGRLRISVYSAYDCYNESGNIYNNSPSIENLNFPLSFSKNKFVAVGCDTYARLSLASKTNSFSTGCLSLCYNKNSLVNGKCSGIGCCQTSIPNGTENSKIILESYNNHRSVLEFNPCSSAFIVGDGQYTFSSLDLGNQDTTRKYPLVVDWAIGNLTCEEAKKSQNAYVCTENSVCNNSDNGPGYRCKCKDGYHGNPYLQNGCRDIDECKNRESLCLSPENCRNVIGNYSCFCPKGYKGDGKKHGQGCIPDQSLRTKIIVDASTAISVLLVIIISLYAGIQRRSTDKLKEDNFKENGGLMLQQLLHSSGRSSEKARIFTEDELKKATKNFSMIIGQGGYGTVYKGTLDDKQIAIKKSKIMDRNQIDQFVNEVIVLSQINHPNVVKLIGCCLETPVPLLVSEFITNNTLHHHLHNGVNGYSMPWKTRLDIAVGIADALAHMHSDAPIHIIHRDVKSANILLDDEFNAKVSDFGVSRLISLTESEIPTLVQGTIGYLDPEYFHSGLLTEKSDVYSFGVVLAELLTGMIVFSNGRPEKDKNLAALFVSSVKNDHLLEIVDERVKNEGNRRQVIRFAEIVTSCLGMTGQKRPTMKEIKRELEELRNENNSHYVESANYDEETESLLRPPTNFRSVGLSLVPDSIGYQVALDIESGR